MTDINYVNGSLDLSRSCQRLPASPRRFSNVVPNFRLLAMILAVAMACAACRKNQDTDDTASVALADIKPIAPDSGESPSGLPEPEYQTAPSFEEGPGAIPVSAIPDALTQVEDAEQKTDPDTQSARDITLKDVQRTDAPKAEDPAAMAARLSSTLPSATDTNGPQLVFEKVQALIKEGEFAQATVLLEEWLKKAPKDSVNRTNLVALYIRLSQFEPALVHLNILTTENPGDGLLWAHVGRAKAQLGRYSEANEAFARAMTTAGDDIDLALDYARNLQRSGRYADAASVLQPFSTSDKRTDEILKELGAAYTSAGEYSKALETYRKLEKLQPGLDTALHTATLSKKFGKCDDVMATLLPFEKEFKTEVPFILLAECALTRGNDKQAETWLKAGMEKVPTCLDCRLLLAETLAKQKRFDEAEKLYTDIAVKNPKDYRSYLQLGKVMNEKKRFADAVRLLAMANERNPNNPEILEHWALAAIAAGEKARAWEIWGQLNVLDADRARKVKDLLIK